MMTNWLKYFLSLSGSTVNDFMQQSLISLARRPRKKFRTPVRYPMVKIPQRRPPQPLVEEEEDTPDPQLPGTPPPESPEPPLIVIKQEPSSPKKRPLAVTDGFDQPTVKKPRLDCLYNFASSSMLIDNNCAQILNIGEQFPQDLISFPQNELTHIRQQKTKIRVEPRIAPQESRIAQERMTTRRSSRQMSSDTVGPTKMIGGPNYFPPNSLALAPLPNPFDYQNTPVVCMDHIWHQSEMCFGYYPPKQIQSRNSFLSLTTQN